MSSTDRDYHQEIVTATLAGDIALVAKLAHEFAAKAVALDEQRTKAAEKKRQQRRAVLRDVKGPKGTSGDVPARPGTSQDTARAEEQKQEQEQVLTTHTTRAGAREAGGSADEIVLDADERAAYTAWRAFFADAPPTRALAVRRWAKSLPADGRSGYVAVANNALQNGVTPDQLESAMAEWATEVADGNVPRPTSGFWREFIGRVWRGAKRAERAEREAAAVGPSRFAPVATEDEGASLVERILALKQRSVFGATVGYAIPKREVAMLGSDVLRAYQALGVDRFLACTSDNKRWLVRDFTQELSRARTAKPEEPKGANGAVLALLNPQGVKSA